MGGWDRSLWELTFKLNQNDGKAGLEKESLREWERLGGWNTLVVFKEQKASQLSVSVE